MRCFSSPAMLRALTAGLVGLTVGGVATAEVAAQTGDEAEFDEARAFISETTLFEPFGVTEADLTPLRSVVESGVLVPEAWLVIMDHASDPLALVMDQMAYHHVAQGEIAGEPWMVSF
ncbi:MAG: hypothetical protein OEU54_05630 [Gemmatimonadota bacterium]|nr:hypothetical protein [Gemmatimonadota bacterium]